MTNGERDDVEEDAWVGGGIGRVTMSCIERASRTEMELPEGNARRPDGLRSADPKLLRLGGPGSMQSQQSWTVEAVDALGLDMALQVCFLSDFLLLLRVYRHFRHREKKNVRFDVFFFFLNWFW